MTRKCNAELVSTRNDRLIVNVGMLLADFRSFGLPLFLHILIGGGMTMRKQISQYSERSHICIGAHDDGCEAK